MIIVRYHCKNAKLPTKMKYTSDLLLSYGAANAGKKKSFFMEKCDQTERNPTDGFCGNKQQRVPLKVGFWDSLQCRLGRRQERNTEGNYLFTNR